VNITSISVVAKLLARKSPAGREALEEEQEK